MRNTLHCFSGKWGAAGKYLFDKVDHLLDRGHVVVVNRPVEDPVVEPGVAVGPLAAKVVHPILVAVAGVQEGRHLADGVAVPGHEPGAGEGHRDDPLGHVGQVQVHAVLLVPTLVLKE